MPGPHHFDHCPNRSCVFHPPGDPGFRTRPYGSYEAGGQRIQRFQCLACKRTFSHRTFSPTYWLKRPELLLKVVAGLVAGSAHRQIARSLNCSHSTVDLLAARVGRHAMLFQARSVRQLAGRLTGPVAFDHFISFEYTQDYPIGLATAVADPSWFILSLSPAVFRRSGRVSRFQKGRLAGRPARRVRDGMARSTRRSFDTLLALVPAGGKLIVRSDGHPAYAHVWRRHPDKARIVLEAHPNPPRGEKGAPRSPEAQDRDLKMFGVDLLHKLFRHSLAHHRRETIAFARRLNGAMERFALFAVWRNFVKGRSERRTGSETPAMQLGLASRRWKWKEVFRRRLFYDHEVPPEPWPELYRREWTTPLLPNNARHNLRFAF